MDSPHGNPTSHGHGSLPRLHNLHHLPRRWVLTGVLVAKLLFAAIVIGAFFALGGCSSVDNKRTPPAPVRIAFPTEAEWRLWGTPAATDYRTFIFNANERVPANFPWTALTHTGYGGVLLVSDVMGTPVAFDLSCPVENRADVRVAVDTETNQAVCPVCKSRYEVFSNFGIPLSGRAHDLGYALTRYNVGPGQGGEYRVITR